MMNNIAYASDIDNKDQLASESVKSIVGQAEQKILLKDFEFYGNSIYSNDELSQVVTHNLNTYVNLEELKAIALEIQKKYHHDGYLITKVVIPEQDFEEDDAVKIVILEGRLGEVTVVGNKKYNSKFINQSLSASEIIAGKAFTVDSLENTLVRINKGNGIKVSSVLKQGAEQGYTDIEILVTEEPMVSTLVDINNYGSKNTGEYRAIAQANVANVTGRGDNASIVGMHTIDGKGSYFVNLAYNTPINALGTKIGGYYSFGNVRVGEELAVLDIKGENTGWGLGLQQDHILDPSNLVQYEVWLESYDVQQDILGMKMTEDKIRKLKFGINYEHINNNSRSFYNINLHQGLGENLGAMENSSVYSTRAISNADNTFTKLTFDWMRLQRINSRITLIPRLFGQYSFDTLVSGEQIAIGGHNSVIGNANSTYSGDMGYNINIEGRYAIRPTTDKYQLTAKLDYGQVSVKKSYLAEKSSEDLAGASIGFIFNPSQRVSFKADYGQSITQKSEKDNYLYLQAKFNY